VHREATSVIPESNDRSRFYWVVVMWSGFEGHVNFVFGSGKGFLRIADLDFSFVSRPYALRILSSGSALLQCEGRTGIWF
jgi:hypothetical protein